MSNHEVGVVHLPVERHQCQHHAGQPASDEDDEKAHQPEHWHLVYRLAEPERRQPAKICTPVGIATSMLAAEKNAVASCGMPTVNMWCTHSPKLMKPVVSTPSTTQR